MLGQNVMTSDREGLPPTAHVSGDILSRNLLSLRMRDRRTHDVLERCLTQLDGAADPESSPTPPPPQPFHAELESTLAYDPRLVLLAGASTAGELQTVAALSSDAPETCFLVVECDPGRLLATLERHDLSAVLESGVICWAVGEPVAERLAEAIDDHALYLIPDADIRMNFSSGCPDDSSRTSYVTAVQSLVEHMTRWRTETSVATKSFTDRLHIRSHEPQRIWSSGSPSQYTATPILRALHRGFRRRGLASVFTELPGSRTNRLVEHRGLVHAAPDTILYTNNPTRLHVPEGEFHRLVWVTDDPALRSHRELAPEYDPEEHVFYADRTFEAELIKQGAKHRIHLPAFAVLEEKGTVREELAYPLVYVGMLHDLEPLLQPLVSADRDVFEESLVEAARSGIGSAGAYRYWLHRDVSEGLLSAARRICSRNGRSFSDHAAGLAFATYAVLTSRRRKAVAEALLPLGLHVYGGRDWREVLGDEYADRYHGIIGYEELADVYRSATLAVNLHSVQCPTCLNVRDFDVLMAGGCLLSDRVSEMGETTIRPGRDCVAAETPREFAEQARLLLADPDRRAALSSSGREAVLTRHLPERRAAAMLDAMRL